MRCVKRGSSGILLLELEMTISNYPKNPKLGKQIDSIIEELYHRTISGDNIAEHYLKTLTKIDQLPEKSIKILRKYKEKSTKGYT